MVYLYIINNYQSKKPTKSEHSTNKMSIPSKIVGGLAVAWLSVCIYNLNTDYESAKEEDIETERIIRESDRRNDELIAWVMSDHSSESKNDRTNYVDSKTDTMYISFRK